MSAPRRIRILVSSPSDLNDERDQCGAVVQELNTTLRALLPEKAVELELIRWETHTHPDLTGEPQQVVDDQIETYHAAVALLAAARELPYAELGQLDAALRQAKSFAAQLGPATDRARTLQFADEELERRRRSSAPPMRVSSRR